MNVQILTQAYGAGVYKPVTATKRADGPDGGQGARQGVKADKQVGEKVEISGYADEMATVRAALNGMPDVRLEMVESIKARINMNDYPLENNLDEALKSLLEKVAV